MAQKNCMKQMIKFTHLGSPWGCVVLGACDVGTATLEDGKDVFVTWGHSLSLLKAKKWQQRGLEVVWHYIRKSNRRTRKYEIVIPKKVMDKIRLTMIWDKK